MKCSLTVCFGVKTCVFIFLRITHTVQACSPPDVSDNGKYSPGKDKYMPGDVVNYQCNDGYYERGERTSKCRVDGYWSNQMPFCDPEAKVKHLSSIDSQGNEDPIQKVPTDCFSLKAGESLRMTLEEPKHLYVVGVYLRQGNINIEISNGIGICSEYETILGADKWVFIRCRQFNVLSSEVILQEKSTDDSSTFCNIKVFTNGEGCDVPPNRRIANGYFKVSRSLAILNCEDGYVTNTNNDRLVCEHNTWVGSHLQCNEIVKDNANTTTKNTVVESHSCYEISTAKTSTETTNGVACSPPDIPRYGNYYPRKIFYCPEEEVNYVCKQDYVRKGNRTSKCQTDGYWSNQTPFCDPESEIMQLSSMDSQGNVQPVPQITIDTPSACFSLKAGESLRMTLENQTYLFGVGMYLIQGNISIEIGNGLETCTSYEMPLDGNLWVYNKCRQSNVSSSYVIIEEKSTSDTSTFCNVKVYTNGEGCKNPPERRIANGYFEVSRSLATLICKDGYETERNNHRLFCLEGVWTGLQQLQCNEILEAYAGTTITSIEDSKKTRKSNSSAIIIAVGFVVVLILIILCAISIYYLRKQRREVAIQREEARSNLGQANPSCESAHYTAKRNK